MGRSVEGARVDLRGIVVSMPQEEHLSPGHFVDSDSPVVRDFAMAAVGSESSPTGRAIALFDSVRDHIWYDPFTCSTDPAEYRASAVARSTRNWCVPKAVLLAAGARAVGIPARLGFADVRNHFQTPRLREQMGGLDVFVYHGYAELFLDDRWVKATPAFNAELCARFGVDPITFDGEHDALLHPYGPGGSTYMEYLADRGTYDDLPLGDILTALHRTYGSGITSVTSSGADEFSAPAPRQDS